MSTDRFRRSGKRRKLYFEILKDLAAALVVAAFTFFFLYCSSHSLAENYIMHRSMPVTDLQMALLGTWLRSLCVAAASIIFICMFLVLLGRRLEYINEITAGVEKLRERHMDFYITPEGNDELTELAESINFLSSSQRQLMQRERELTEEREAFIRSLSHDIRTPLTSILSYSELMAERKDLSREEMKKYLALVHSKSEQMKRLISQLSGQSDVSVEKIDDISLLMRQLAFEWEELLDEDFDCRVDLSQCGSFPCAADISGLCRIIDNLASNVQKYAAPAGTVSLTVRTENHLLLIIQENEVAGAETADKTNAPANRTAPESSLIGLKNIRKMAEASGGRMKVVRDEKNFHICIEIILTALDTDAPPPLL